MADQQDNTGTSPDPHEKPADTEKNAMEKTQKEAAKEREEGGYQ